MASLAKVYLVGAGPGDPGLLTLRGLICLAKADFVLYDGLANQQLLQFAPNAKHICVGKHGRLPFWPQGKIHEKMIELAQPGNQVVRLKGGDPAVFARTAEEAEALSDAGIPFEVVPGITSGLAVSSYVGIPLTHRDHASAVALVTGKQRDGADEALDWEALARFPGTLVFYMGVTTAQHWTSQLMAAGKSPDTPAAIVRRCTWPDQMAIRCKLSEVAPRLTPSDRIRPPVAVVVGKVADVSTAYTLGERTELAGWEANALKTLSAEVIKQHSSQESFGSNTVLLASNHASNRGMADLLLKKGIHCAAHPVLTHHTSPVDDHLAMAFDCLRRGQLSGITFSSQHAVASFLEQLRQSQLDIRQLSGVLLCCVGNATAKALAVRGLVADVVPDANFGAAALLKKLNTLPTNLKQGKWLVTKTTTSGHELAEGIKQQGGQPIEVETYHTETIEGLPTEIAAQIQSGDLRLVAATSSQIARSLHRLLHDLSPDSLKRIAPVAFSKQIASVCDELAWPAVAVASQCTKAALTAAILEAHRGS